MIDIHDLKRDYRRVETYLDHYAVVMTHEITYFVIDLNTGDIVVPETDKYYIRPLGRYLRYRDHCGEYGIRDEHGGIILPCRYSKIQDPFEYGLSRTIGQSWGLIDMSGRFVLEEEYYHLSPVYADDKDSSLLYVIAQEKDNGPKEKIYLTKDGFKVIDISRDDIPHLPDSNIVQTL